MRRLAANRAVGILKTSCLSLLAALALALFAGAPTSCLACTCGVERWSVKTGTDPDAGLVDLTRSTAATISYLASLPAPASLPDNGRVQPTETTQFLLDVLLTAYKREDEIGRASCRESV